MRASHFSKTCLHTTAASFIAAGTPCRAVIRPCPSASAESCMRIIGVPDLVQHMRLPGSGTASPRDIDLAWEDLQAGALGDLVLNRNARPDGRGLSDLRPLDCEVGAHQTLQGLPFFLMLTCVVLQSQHTSAGEAHSLPAIVCLDSEQLALSGPED